MFEYSCSVEAPGWFLRWNIPAKYVSPVDVRSNGAENGAIPGIRSNTVHRLAEETALATLTRPLKKRSCIF
jgi:hypothetical protein